MPDLPQPDEIIATYPEVAPIAAIKAIDHLDKHCRNWIAHSPFLCMSSTRPDGRGDVSPRGDAPGFVQVLDDRTLAIPDRPGNNRLDTIKNIQTNPEVGLIFFIPGVEESLRVSGRATISADPTLLAGMEVNGKLPRAAIIVTVSEAMLHCAKALKRSKLWDPASHIAPGIIPSLARIVTDHINMPDRHDEVAARTEEAYRTKLY